MDAGGTTRNSHRRLPRVVSSLPPSDVLRTRQRGSRTRRRAATHRRCVQRRRRFHGARARVGEAAPQIRRLAPGACRSWPAGRERRVEQALRARGASLRLPFVALRRDIQRKRGESPEAAAREARYALLARAMKPGEVLVTAQHRDDQVETLLLQLFRGAGVAGLAAMPRIAPFGPGPHRAAAAWTIRAPTSSNTRATIACSGSRTPRTWSCISRAISCGAKLLPIFANSGSARISRSRAPRATWPRPAELLGALAHRDLARVEDGDGVNVAALRALPRSRRGECPARLHRRIRHRSAVHGADDGDRRQPARRTSGCSTRNRAGMAPSCAGAAVAWYFR